MTYEDKACEILRKQYGCEVTPAKCKGGNFAKDGIEWVKRDGKFLQLDVCPAIKQLVRLEKAMEDAKPKDPHKVESLAELLG